MGLTFSQCGEDAILMFIIRSLKLRDVQYFDIGTNDPRNMNNTYLLYLNNFRGVCIEPDPRFHSAIAKLRPGDVLIPAGVSLEDGDNADFYIMDDATLNTFSLREATNLVESHNRTIKEKITVPLIKINDVFQQYAEKEKHLVLSIDIEGLDLLILESIDFTRFRPGIICVETIEYSRDLSGKKDSSIEALLDKQGYFLYADTHINSIFLDCGLIPQK